MRGVACIAGLVAAAAGGVVAGCSFQVHGLDPSGNLGGVGSNAPQGSPPAASTPPPTDDAGAPAGDMATLPIGAACTSNGECGSGRTCAQMFWTGRMWLTAPGGYCTMDCSNGNVCPTGSSCAQFSFGSYCLASCTEDPECRAGYKCCSETGIHGCTTDALCQPPPPPPPKGGG